MELVLVRHAESIWNAENRWQGQSDVALSPRGHEEAHKVAQRLARVPFDRVVSSDLSRAFETARAIAEAQAQTGSRALEIERDPSWREMNLGRWCGLLHAEVAERYPDELAALVDGRPLPIGGGESLPGFEARAADALARTLRDSAGAQRVLVLTHGGVIRAILMRLLEVSGRRAFVGATNTSITTLRASDGELLLTSFNCDAHLARDPEPSDVIVGGAEARPRVIAHLGLREEVLQRLAVPSPSSTTRLVPAPRAAMRSFAAPALAGLDEPMPQPKV